jgi:Fic family protein
MAFEPQIDFDKLEPLLDALESARQDILALDVPPVLEPWLQQFTEARGAHMSTRIEGNPMTEEEVREAFARPERGSGAAELENLNYRDAVRFAQEYANDPSADIDGGFIRALHFLIVREVDPYASGGRYRFEQNVVRSGARDIYMPPPPTEVSRLMGALIAWLRASRGSVHPLVLAAVAHIELVSIHPFDDGNGRAARALTSYFFDRGGWRLRDFVSAEQVFGQNIEAYYSELGRVQGGRYLPQQTDLTGWVAWFLVTLQIEVLAVGGAAAGVGWYAGLRDALTRQRIPGRLADGLTYIWLMRRVSRSEYARAVGVSPATAASDLGKLLASGFVAREGRGPATRYVSLERPFDEMIEGARIDAVSTLVERVEPQN